jgi:hypothetical protein
MYFRDQNLNIEFFKKKKYILIKDKVFSFFKIL